MEATEKTTKTEGKVKDTQKSRVSQNALPLYSLENVLVIAQALKDNFAGQPTAPLLVAEACKISPTSSNWRYLTGCSIAYGITNGGWNAQNIQLTELGERIVSPLEEGDDFRAKRQAVLIPTILKEFYMMYNRNKLPRKDIGLNVLQKKGVPVERLESTWTILRKNAEYVGILRVISGNEYIFLDNDDKQTIRNFSSAIVQNTEDTSEDEVIPDELAERLQIDIPNKPKLEESVEIKRHEKPNVFISHGKNSQVIIDQLKELLSYGQMIPIVSVERETTAVSVPDKVFSDMRNCDAGIINIVEEEFLSENGTKVKRLNENVLIEIGAAMALYEKRVILLCKKGTQLPSNLQGLYRCEYEGDQLDYSATIKILKTMQELRDLM